MHLIETYSSSCRLKIDRPWIAEKFYPLNSEKFISLQSQGAMDAKNFQYWQEVVDLLKPIFNKYKINIIQLGSKNEQPLNNVINLLGLTNLGQSYYIVKKALLHTGTDSSLIHFASVANKKIVGLYSISNPEICGPYNFNGNSNNHICLEPEFEPGKTYSFHPQENPKSIDSIKPETVAKSILKLLGLKETINCETIFIGKDYKKQIVECIPDHIIDPRQLKEAVIHIRADLLFNPDGIYGNASQRPSVIVSDKPLDLDILKQFKQNIKNILYLLYIKNKERDLIFIKQLHDSGIPYILLSHEQENLAQFKFDYLDFNMIHYCPINKKEEIKNCGKINSNTYFKTNKLILSKGQVFLSRAHWEAGIPMNKNGENLVIDNEIFFRDSDYSYYFNQEEVSKS